MLKLSGLILVLTCLFTPCAFAIVYKCDDNGKISYQDTKCDSGIETVTSVQDSSKVHSKTAPPSTDNVQNPNSPSPNPSPAPNTEPKPLNDTNHNQQEQSGISQEQIQQIVNSLPKSSQ